MDVHIEFQPNVPFSSEERAELEAALVTYDLTDLSTLHGFMTAVISGPPIPFDEWLDCLWQDSDPQFASEENFQRVVQLIGRFFNATAASLAQTPTAFAPVLYIAQEGEEPGVVADGWTTGYLLGITLREKQWERFFTHDDAAQFIQPIMVLFKPDDPEFADFRDSKSQQTFVDLLGSAATQLFIAWQFYQQSSPRRKTSKKQKRTLTLR